MKVQEALQELRKEKRNFEQSVDLIINLRSIDIKKEPVNAVIALPHSVKEKKVCAFLTNKSAVVRTITPIEFPKYKDKKMLKNLVKEYDFFIGEAKLMPQVATVFGKVLGPVGKMPSPQLGVLINADEANLKELLGQIGNSLKIRAKEASVKASIGNEKMDDKKLQENIASVYQGVVNALPNKKDNVKSVLLKLTMSKPIKVEVE